MKYWIAKERACGGSDRELCINDSTKTVSGYAMVKCV